MNNFDQSSNSVNLELNVFWDTELSRIYFEENFKRLDNDQFLFIDYGNNSDDFDFTDLDNYDLKSNTVRNIYLNLRQYYGSTEDLKDDSLYYMDQYVYKLNKLELLKLAENVLLSEEYQEFLQGTFKPLFEVITVTGYCQGDQADVIFREKDIKEYNFKDRDQFLSMMQDYFCNLFYDAPLAGRLLIDDQEIYLDDFQESRYNYDKEKTLKYCEKVIDHPKKEYILEWLGENLPDQPDYE